VYYPKRRMFKTYPYFLSRNWGTYSPVNVGSKSRERRLTKLNGESDELERRRTSKSELAEVNDNGGLTIEWEFELRKDVVMGKGKELLSTFYIFFQTLYISDKVHSPDSGLLISDVAIPPKILGILHRTHVSEMMPNGIPVSRTRKFLRCGDGRVSIQTWA